MPARPVIAITTSETDCRIEIRGVRQGAQAPSRIATPVTYMRAVACAGGIPVLLAGLDPQDIGPQTLAAFDGLLISGGIDVDPASYGQDPHPQVTLTEPSADALELAVLDAAEQADLPVLGICRGMQLMNVHRGGTMIQHLPDLPGLHPLHYTVDRPKLHDLTIAANSTLADITGTGRAQVNSIHHQAADRIGDGLIVSAHAPDGVVEAVEDPALRYWLGVQWHPEELGCQPSERILRSLIAAAAAR